MKWDITRQDASRFAAGRDAGYCKQDARAPTARNRSGINDPGYKTRNRQSGSDLQRRFISFNVGCWTLSIGRFLLHHCRLLLGQAMKRAQAPD